MLFPAPSPGANSEPLVQPLVFHAFRLPLDPATDIFYRIVLIAVVFLPAVLSVARFAIWWERKIAGHIQSRIGPNRVGRFGLLQSLADGIKLITKEDLRPRAADRWLFGLAPYLVFAPVFAAFAALPFAPALTFEPRLSVGLFWVLAVLAVEVMGVILAGWSSNNKWSVYGAMREACQIVSYEIPLGVTILIAVMSSGTLNLVDTGWLQGGGLHTWLIFRNPFSCAAFLLFFIASLASNKRAPFDLPESDSELVAGYHTEYSGLRFGFFFFAEYAAMFVMGAIATTLFLGAWNDPFGLVGYYLLKLKSTGAVGGLFLINLCGAAIFIFKTLCFVFAQIWLRWTLPRPRIDQVLYACVQVMLPSGCVLLLGTALWQLAFPELPGVPWAAYEPWNSASWTDHHAIVALLTQSILALAGLSLILLTIGWLGLSFTRRGGIRKRLSEPALIWSSPRTL